MATLPAFYYNSTTINLSSPLAKDDPYSVKSNRKDSFSQGGVRQSAYDYTEEIKDIELTFLTGSEKDALRTMFDTWTDEGKAIRFIPDQTVPATYDDVYIVDKNLVFEREFVGTDFWKIKFKIRKEIS